MNDRNRPPLAVALHYTGSGAPRIVAKGGGQVAERIIETARDHNVPLQEDAALAAALSRLDLGREIPRELYVAVAHVLAFAWSVAGKKNVKVNEEAAAQENNQKSRQDFTATGTYPAMATSRFNQRR